jgi:hypothetical protein
MLCRFNLSERPCNPPPRLRVHRQEVDDVGPYAGRFRSVAIEAEQERLAEVLVGDQVFLSTRRPGRLTAAA